MNIAQNTIDLLTAIADNAEKQRLSNQSPVCDAEEIRDIPYLSEDQKVHLLDLYVPKARKGVLPVIVTIHGGGWIRGSKESIRPFGMYLASKGFCVVNADYSPAKGNDLRTQVLDVIHVLAWVSKYAKEYKLDTDKVFLCGESTGAHLCLLAGITQCAETVRAIYQAPKVDISLRGFALSSPVASLHISAGVLHPAFLAVSKALFGEKTKNSPYFYCSSIQDVLKPSVKIPPVFFTSSEEDPLRGQALDLSHILNKRNADSEFLYCPPGVHQHLGHAFHVYYPEYSESMTVNEALLNFIQKNI